MGKRQKSPGNAGMKLDFDSFYTSQWAERWTSIRAAFSQDDIYYDLHEGLLQSYFLDPASVWATQLLPLPESTQSTCRVLDLCAAPGGKSLVLIQRLAAAGIDFHLTANDRSSQRRRRLHSVMDQYLPAELRESIRISGHDASRWGLYEKNCYDMIIADVPCSSERHVVNSPEHLAKWSPARARRLAQQAYAILLAAIDAAVPGGWILYSTCSVNKAENDGVIERVLKRRKSEIQVKEIINLKDSVSHWLPGIEATEHGAQILPDSCEGAGPIFAGLLRKSPL